MEVEVFCCKVTLAGADCQDIQSMGHDLDPVSPENKAGWPHLKCEVWLQMRDIFQRVL